MAHSPKSTQDYWNSSFGEEQQIPTTVATQKNGVIVGGIDRAGLYNRLPIGTSASGTAVLVDLISAESVSVSVGTINTLGTVDKVSTIVAGTQNTLGTVGVVNNVVTGTMATLGTVGVVNGGTLGVVSSVSNLAAGTITSVANLAAGTVTSVANLAAGTVTALALGTVTQSTLMAGEDQTNDVMKTEQQFSYYHYVGTAGTVVGTVKAAAGFLHTVTVNTVGTSPVTIYDSAGTSATVIGILTAAVDNTKTYNVKCTTGITLSGTSAVDITVAYR
jgi:hypothetical protein